MVARHSKTLPLPCVSTSFVAKTLPLSCVFTAFELKHCPLCLVFPLPFVHETAPLPCVPPSDIQHKAPHKELRNGSGPGVGVPSSRVQVLGPAAIKTGCEDPPGRCGGRGDPCRRQLHLRCKTAATPIYAMVSETS